MAFELFVVVALIVVFIISFCGLLQKIRHSYEQERGKSLLKPWSSDGWSRNRRNIKFYAKNLYNYSSHVQTNSTPTIFREILQKYDREHGLLFLDLYTHESLIKQYVNLLLFTSSVKRPSVTGLPSVHIYRSRLMSKCHYHCSLVINSSW